MSNVRAHPGELKLCPFCGSADIANVSAGHAGPTDWFHAGDEIFAVNCKMCGASVPNRYRNDLVVDAWNKRAESMNKQLLVALKQLAACMACYDETPEEYLALKSAGDAIAAAEGEMK